MAQAEDFIEDWKKSFAEIWCELIKDALDRGYRPRDIDAFRPGEIGLIIDQFLCEPSKCSEVNDITEKTRTQLSLQDDRTNDRKNA